MNSSNVKEFAWIKKNIRMVSSISATKPKSGKTDDTRTSKVKHDFKMAADGRLIITEDGSDDETGSKKGR